jgi:RNA polymerase sigma-70 factor, ECF subfamily
MSTANYTRPQDAREQLAAIYDAFADGLYRRALMIVADPAAAEDAVQQAFVKLAAMRRPLNELASAQAYLCAAVRNECYRILARMRPNLTEVEPPGPALLEPVDAALAADDERRKIEAALRALPPEQREVVHLKVYENWTFQQIAANLGVSINTAASRYRYATEKLRQLLADCRPSEV